ncbi:hypothetical protein JCM19037_3064 [Geomicrobium sp. JCM 19037]|nr:hypothetical protein JCM19037_3064 [Geomicrobium sp. JCM 19037]
MSKEPFVLDDTNEFFTLPSPPGDAKAGFSTRKQGVSSAPYNSLNLGLHVSDRNEDVLENRSRFAASIGRDEQSFVFAEQVHGNDVQRVGSLDRGAGSETLATAIAGADGFYTTDPTVTLMSLYADCVPLFFIGEEGKIVGLAHAGWKGTVGQIGSNMLGAWKEEGVDLQTVHAYIGPSIGQANYEVNDTIITSVDACLPHSVRRPYYPTNPGKYQLDLKETNRVLLQSAGVQRPISM